jgi:hypothetical protein
MKKITLLFAAGLFVLGMKAQSFTATYAFDSVKTTTGLTDPTPLINPAGITLGAFSAVGTSLNPSASARFSFTGWPTGALNGATTYASLTGIMDTTKYYQVSITPSATYNMDLSSVTFNMQRSGTGVRTYAVRSSADGYMANLAASIMPADTNLTVEPGNIFFFNKDNVTTSQAGSMITLGGAAFTGQTGTISFRFYGFNAEGTAGTFSIDNVVISGMANGSAGIVNNTMSELVIYPNPSANGSFVLDMGNVFQASTLTVYNVLGKVVYTSQISSPGKHIIDMQNVANGRYFFNLKSEKSTITRTITVNR